MANIAPLLLGLGAAFLFLRKKDTSAGTGDTGSKPAPDTGWGVEGTGTTPCDLLLGIWAEANGPATSPLAIANGGFTTNPKLVVLTLTPDAFKAADLFFMDHIQKNGMDGPEAEAVAVFAALKHITSGLNCNWAMPDHYTPRMKQVERSLVTLYREGVYQAP